MSNKEKRERVKERLRKRVEAATEFLVKKSEKELPTIKTSNQSIITSEQSTKKIIHLLLDSMIIHEIINNENIVEELTKKIQGTEKNLVLVDRILIETIHMEKQEYSVSLTQDQIIKSLRKIGTVKKIQIDYADKEMLKAREIFDSKKYVNEEGVPLSVTDCILLQMHLTEQVQLITRDRLLIKAAEIEGVPITPI